MTNKTATVLTTAKIWSVAK